MFIYLCCVQWMGGGEVGSRDHDCQNVVLCLVLGDVFLSTGTSALLVEVVEQAQDTPLAG